MSTLSAQTLLGEVKESTRRISELVAAVKSYSQLDRASVQQTDVTEGLESTLVMLAHRIPPGVTVVRDYGTDVPRIDAIAGELNQVWTNLIDNAIDAMDGTGTLRVSTRADGDGRGRRDRRHRARHVRRRRSTTPSSRSSPPRASARAPGSAWTSPAASSSTGTAARSPSTRRPARRC